MAEKKVVQVGKKLKDFKLKDHNGQDFLGWPLLIDQPLEQLVAVLVLHVLLDPHVRKRPQPADAQQALRIVGVRERFAAAQVQDVFAPDAAEARQCHRARREDEVRAGAAFAQVAFA